MAEWVVEEVHYTNANTTLYKTKSLCGNICLLLNQQISNVVYVCGQVYCHRNAITLSGHSRDMTWT